MAAREKMPMYATDNAFTISGQQLRKIMKGRTGIFKGEPPNYDHIRDGVGYKVTQLKDGTWWVRNYRDGAPLFAPDYWHQLPQSVGNRARAIYEFVEAM